MKFNEFSVFRSRDNIPRFAYWSEWNLSFWRGYPDSWGARCVGYIRFTQRFGGEVNSKSQDRLIKIMRSWIENGELSPGTIFKDKTRGTRPQYTTTL